MQRLKIRSIDHLCSLMHLPLHLVGEAARPGLGRYRVREVEDRPGKTRTVEEPCDVLKDVQRALLSRVFSLLPCSRIEFGDGSGRDHIDAARKHLGKSWIGSLDISRFFPSVRAGVVRFSLKSVIDAPSEVIDFIVALVSWNGRLPTGAPTSPRLAGLVLLDVDLRLAEFSNRRGLTVTRYVDDIVVSGDNPRTVRAALRESRVSLASLGLRENIAKGQIRRCAQSPVVYGLRMGDDVSVPREFKRKVRNDLRRVARYGAYENELRSIRGKIDYISRVHPLEGARLAEELDRLDREVA